MDFGETCEFRAKWLARDALIFNHSFMTLSSQGVMRVMCDTRERYQVKLRAEIFGWF